MEQGNLNIDQVLLKDSLYKCFYLLFPTILVYFFYMFEDILILKPCYLVLDHKVI